MFGAYSHTLSLTKPPEVNTPASSNATRTLFCINNPDAKCENFNNVVTTTGWQERHYTCKQFWLAPTTNNSMKYNLNKFKLALAR